MESQPGRLVREMVGSATSRNQSSSLITQPSGPPTTVSGSYSPRPVPKSAVRFSKDTAPQRRASMRKPFAVRQVRRALHKYHEWKSGHHYLGRYSIEKLLAFEDYCDNSSVLRVVAVVMLTPFPGLLAILLVATIPLNSPLEGVSGNATFYVHSALSYVVMSIGLLLFIRGALGWPEAWYSHKQMIIISILVCTCNELVFVAIGSVWEFPVPFRDILGIVPYFIFFTVFHILVVGKTVFIKSQAQLLQYIPLLVAQSATLIIFQAYAIIFEHVSVATQVVLTVCFPLLKSVVKRVIWHFSTCLSDVATDVTVCVAEIFGSLFLNVCIQNVRSPFVGGIIIAIDIAQAILETRMYLSHKFIVDGRLAIQTAVKVVEGALFPGVLRGIESSFNQKSSHNFTSLASKGASIRLDQADDRPKAIGRTRTRSFNKIATGVPIVEVDSIETGTDRDARDDSQAGDTSVLTSRRTSLFQAINRRGIITVDDIAIDHKEHAKLLTQTLQLLFAAEVLTFAEYMEVVTSVTYALYMLALYRLPYSKYNLSFIGLDAEEFRMSMVTVGVYIVLEIVSMAMLCVLMHRKYGFSALYQLSFVLEKYWMSVQGKFVGSLALIFILNTVHHGMDLSLRFDWAKVLDANKPSV